MCDGVRTVYANELPLSPIVFRTYFSLYWCVLSWFCFLQLSEFFKATLSVGTVAAVSTVSSNSVSVMSTSAPENYDVLFRSLQYALFTTSFVEILGGLFFLLTALYVVDDKAAAARRLEGKHKFNLVF